MTTITKTIATKSIILLFDFLAGPDEAEPVGGIGPGDEGITGSGGVGAAGSGGIVCVGGWGLVCGSINSFSFGRLNFFEVWADDIHELQKIRRALFIA